MAKGVPVRFKDDSAPRETEKVEEKVEEKENEKAKEKENEVEGRKEWKEGISLGRALREGSIGGASGLSPSGNGEKVDLGSWKT